ncbi:MAG: GAF domain-containing protein, partial [Bacteroidetes bacterium]
FLEGYDTHWSEWTKETKKEYTNLSAGNYRFKLRAKNIYGTISNESVYEFRVKAPWYQTKWAFMVYFLLSISIIWFFIQFNTRRLVLQKQRLEDIVKERTSEISLQSEELKKQKSEIEIQKNLLEGKNKEITGEKDKTDQAYNNIKILSEIGQKITATLSLDSIREILYENISVLVDTSDFGIGLYDEKTKSIGFENYIERGIKIPYKECSIADEDDLTNWCFYNRQEVFINDYLEVYKKIVPNAPYPKRNSPKAMIYLPLIVNEKAIGVLTVQSYERNVYDTYQLSILKNLAVYVAIALQNSESYTEIADQKQIIESKNHQIEHINKSLMDSINYASRIQSAMLPEIDKVRLTMPDSFILLKPRNIVSGDFYWFAETHIQNIRRTVIAALDCTGHGVPGAFMSMIGNELLNQIVTQENITEPNLILDILNKGIVAALKQEQTSNRDGMDGTICTIDWQSRTVEMAAANNPMIYIQNKEVFEAKADKMPIGYVKGSKSANFSKTIIDVSLPTYFYLFSDGYPDQFGGEEYRKFMKKRLRELFFEIHEKSFEEQHQILDTTIEAWKLGRKQTDDILVIGFKV